jgi:hypothetical protein
VNQSLTPLSVSDPVLRARRAHEATHLQELAAHAPRIVLEPWSVGPSPRVDVSPALESKARTMVDGSIVSSDFELGSR